MADKISDPEYIDLEKTRVRFKLTTEAGVESVAELTVPRNKERGVNKYWDRIMDEFDIEEMRQRRNRQEVEARNQQRHRQEKNKNRDKVLELQTLFNAKAKVLETPFIKDSDISTKSAIRRAPTIDVLNFLVHDITRKFMEENDMDYEDYLDYLDDWEEEKEAAEEAAKSS